MDRLWTLFQIRRRGSYSPAELETPNMNGAKENKKGKKTWKNIFQKHRKPKAGKEALEGQGPQQPEGDEGLELRLIYIPLDRPSDISLDKFWDDDHSSGDKKKGKKKWRNIFKKNHKPKAGKLPKKALEGQVPQQPEGDEGLEPSSSLDETRGNTYMVMPSKVLDSESDSPANISLDKPRDISLNEPGDDDLSPVHKEKEKKKWRNIFKRNRKPKAGKLPKEALDGQVPQHDETRGYAEMLLPVEELEVEPEAPVNTSLDETRGEAEMLLTVRELEAKPEDLVKINLDETRGEAEMLLPVRELEAEPEDLVKTNLDETRGEAEMLLPVRELEAEPEDLVKTNLDETRGDAEMLLPVRELEAEAEALKTLEKTSLLESEKSGDTEADLLSKDNDGRITGENGKRKKTRRGTRGRGRKINYKKKENNGSEMINKVNVEAKAEIEMKNVHPEQKVSTTVLKHDQPLDEDRMQLIGRGDPEDSMREEKITQGIQDRGRKIKRTESGAFYSKQEKAPRRPQKDQCVH
ncbi:uncharacterized protein LOC134321401 [Trichomycterus rosablanca]|uniref:uncharacterized protein LOC134321401 n=1 Tax=Trichomycterus rosablanca TaxID=2290929 RepID=UPI002F34F37F